MSTRSAIGMSRADGRVEAIYCHFDGYIRGVGKTLIEHYQDPEKVKELMALGDLSSIGPEIGVKHDFNSRPETICRAYGRDQGESDTGAKVHGSTRDFWYSRKDYGAEYMYLFKDGKWFVKVGKSPYTELH